ncbi:ATP-binding protein [Actinomadura bangladeshensis]|uniref:ATP-binding protein n=1 Tax=Actinomadura bangladeshensis TaxID=453573 RepID=A0A4V2XNN5_9ACTN|nr:ATP-binding protein [Actinomadura bangladeshensis]TDC18916.1 ATP-binding protein [Actinomadura bangladeshensis]
MTDSAGHLLARIELLRRRVRVLVEDRAAADPTAQDPFRGLYVSPEGAARLAELGVPRPGRDAAHDRAVGEVEDGAGDTRLARLAAGFGLDAFDAELLLIALAPDVDRSFEPLYGYLNDDVSRRRATVGLALDLCGSPAASAAARARLGPSGPLLAGGLVVLEDEDRPFLGRALRVPDRVTDHLLGGDHLDPALSGAVTEVEDACGPVPPELRALAPVRRVVYLRETRQGSGMAPGAAVLGGAGRPVLRADLSRLDEALIPTLIREARLRSAGIVAGPVTTGTQVRAFTDASTDAFTDDAGAGAVAAVLTGVVPYDPAWSRRQPLVLEFAAPPEADAWAAELPPDVAFDVAAATAPYRFDRGQIRRAVRAALDYAALEGVPPEARHLHRGARLQNAVGLQRHARRVSPAVGWDDLVLPPEEAGRLGELVARARHRHRVLGDWGLRTGGGRGRGVVALFAGESGTGKTLAAEVVAGELGLDLYVVDLSAVVDKYVGETEKNLERIFTEADRLDAVLLFDEADAVFGKRSEVKDARDRYANLESAFLLQRLESFDGIAILTTNLRANIDDAFTRRLDVIVDFPFPDAAQRRALWAHCLAPPLPCGDDLDLARCAREFELAGGAIRSAATTAAYLAAAAGRPVSMADVLTGAEREYLKMGRLLPGTW